MTILSKIHPYTSHVLCIPSEPASKNVFAMVFIMKIETDEPYMARLHPAVINK